jgi:hypothetical protein
MTIEEESDFTTLSMSGVRLELQNASFAIAKSLSLSSVKQVLRHNSTNSLNSSSRPETLPTPKEMAQINRQRMGSQSDRFSFVALPEPVAGGWIIRLCQCVIVSAASQTPSTSTPDTDNASSIFDDDIASFQHLMCATQVYTWGTNDCGQLGVGDCEPRTQPTLVARLTGLHLIAAACGWRHTAVLTTTGQV